MLNDNIDVTDQVLLNNQKKSIHTTGNYSKLVIDSDVKKMLQRFRWWVRLVFYLNVLICIGLILSSIFAIIIGSIPLFFISITFCYVIWLISSGLYPIVSILHKIKITEVQEDYNQLSINVFDYLSKSLKFCFLLIIIITAILVYLAFLFISS